MAATLSFTLRTSTNVKTVHLLGSWDNYARQLPLSQDKAKAGAWKGSFRFQGATIKPGQRYWYYYIMDGYHVSHDPAKPSTKEPTTGRTLNILNIDASGQAAPAATKQRPAPINTKIAAAVATGRPLSPSRIAHPKPSKPYASRQIREADYSASPIEDVISGLESTSLYDSRNFPVSPVSSISSGSDISSSGCASPASSLSSVSSVSSCRCNRYGVTRAGKKILLDCGGDRCGYSDSDAGSSICSSDEEESEFESEAESEDEAPVPVAKRAVPAARRVAVRG